jgi:uncharacterized protein (UPF0335 family)
MSSNRFKSFIERIERLEAEKKNLADDIGEIYTEAKDEGYDTKAMRKVVSIRRMDPAEVEEQEAIIETYMSALK